MTITQPQILEETSDYAVVYKPPKMHSTPLAQKNDTTLFDWFTGDGCRSAGEKTSELMHRLDYETHGLVLFAKNKKSFDFFKDLQNNGKFVKEYSAVCQKKTVKDAAAEGFPPPPDIDLSSVPKTIMSYFRPYGRGRKLVRPVIDEKTHKETAKDNGGFYRTEIISMDDNIFTVRIRRGFRHQIRCHLCWIGFPILNDPLYGQEGNNNMALRAHALFFIDPSSGEQREYRMPPLKTTYYQSPISSAFQ